MPSLAPPPDTCPPAHYYFTDATSMQGSEYFVRDYEAVRVVDSSSRLASNNYESANRWIAALPSLLNASEAWDYEEFPAPNLSAVEGAQDMLRAMRFNTVFPEAIKPSAEGGIRVCVCRACRNRAIVESLNDNERYALLYNLDGKTLTIEWPALDSQRQRHLLARLESSLARNSPCP